jgi:quinoprotein glucose dehydrogenase
VYVPTGSASPDFYGGERLGDNRYANSIVALDAGTGKVSWHYQLVHHDVWDYDLASQPTLVDLVRDGQPVPALIQGTKMGMIFTFDRRTGVPLFPIEERPVPQGAVSGEELSPTQPFPVAPPPVARHDALDESDAYGLVLFDKWACERTIRARRSEGIYTPPSVQGTLVYPFYGGGINWGGIAFDQASATAVVFSMDLAASVTLVPREKLIPMARSGEFDESEFARQSGTPYGMRREVLLSPLGMPCVTPPWGTLSAIDMNAGTIEWQVPLGTIEDVAPAFVPDLRLGVPGSGGPIVTASGLVFIGTAMDDYLRAFDLRNGKEIWRGRLPAGGQATPMSYMHDGRQYVVIAAGGHPNMGTTPGDYVVAWALPRPQ